MSSVQNLRALINERLTAAAEEIFTEFEKTIVQYEEEIDRQRRLLDITWKPQITLHRIDVPQQHVFKEEEVFADQLLCNKESSSSLNQEDPEPPQIKEDQEKLCTSQDQEDPEPPRIKEEQEIFCTRLDETIIQYRKEFDCQRRWLNINWIPQLKLHRTDLHQQHVCQKEEFFVEKQLDNQERNYSLDQKDPEPLQIKEQQEGLCFERVHLVPETNTDMVVPAYEDSGHSELEPNSDQLLLHNSPAAESPHQQGRKYVDSGSTRNVELKPKKRHCSNSNHRQRDEDISPVSKSNSSSGTEKKSVKCGICGKVFKDKSQTKKHHRIHTGRKPYVCKMCRKTLRRSGSFTVHMRSHTVEKSYPCNICGEKFKYNSALKSHMTAHSSEKVFSCEKCGKNFSQRGNLLTHVRTHTGEKPYSCETCGKNFSQSGNLLAHIRTHTGEKLHSCKTCGKSFSQSGNLVHHMRTHSSEKPYCRETCGKSSTRHCRLLYHRTSHTGQKSYHYNNCGKRFKYALTLKSHTRIHTGKTS